METSSADSLAKVTKELKKLYLNCCNSGEQITQKESERRGNCVAVLNKTRTKKLRLKNKKG